MKNIHLLPTDKPSRLSIKDGILILHRLQWRKGTHHIHITSDEEIKFNDYITDGYKVWQWKDNSSLLGRKKIILTTDIDLIKDGVQAIDDEFLEWFVKNPSCEWVEMKLLDAEEKLWEEYYKKNSIYPKYPWYYRIIIPKEEPKQERMYSEEDMLNFAWFLKENLGQYSCDRKAHFGGKYFEQFKKK